MTYPDGVRLAVAERRLPMEASFLNRIKIGKGRGGEVGPERDAREVFRGRSGIGRQPKSSRILRAGILFLSDAHGALD